MKKKPQGPGLFDAAENVAPVENTAPAPAENAAPVPAWVAHAEGKVLLSDFVENPDNPQTVTDEDFRLLVKSLMQTPHTLAASKIAFATDYVAVDGTDYAGKRVVIAGNKRLRALREIAAKGGIADGVGWLISPAGEVPADWFFDLTPLGGEARDRWLVKSNVMSGEWDAKKLLALFDEDELGDLMGADDLDEILKTLDAGSPEASPGEPAAEPADGDNPEYQAFVDKFKPKKTTDDCYTPETVYNAVADWVARKYNLDRAKFVRPFWPGGDYKTFEYPPGCVVVDNPPFSILVEIVRFYLDGGLPFFLFAPALTLFVDGASKRCHYVATTATLTYENGAKVATSFVTSLGDKLIEVAPDLRDIIKDVDAANNRGRELPKLEYPNELITSARLGYLANHHTPLSVAPEDAHFVRKLDAQKDDAIFGGGFLLSERAAAERAAAERAAAKKYELSERERAIVAGLGRKTEGGAS